MGNDDGSGNIRYDNNNIANIKCSTRYFAVNSFPLPNLVFTLLLMSRRFLYIHHHHVFMILDVESRIVCMQAILAGNRRISCRQNSAEDNSRLSVAISIRQQFQRHERQKIKTRLKTFESLPEMSFGNRLADAFLHHHPIQMTIHKSLLCNLSFFHYTIHYFPWKCLNSFILESATKIYSRIS